MEIKQKKYHGIESIVLENDFLIVTVVPSRGGKIVSIVYKPMDLELLWQNEDFGKKELVYGQLFEEGDFCGFDEMFPAITAGVYQEFPWEGICIPDHGEVWTQSWAYETKPWGITLWIAGIRFPYILEKTIWLNGPIVEHSYRLINTCGYPFHYIYAAHPLFNAEPGSKLIIAKNLNTIINSVPSVDMQEYGCEFSFPISEKGTDDRMDLSVMNEPKENRYKKYYFKDINYEGWCILSRPKKGLNIMIDYSSAVLPYLGIWMNEGGLCNQYNIAPEPASAAMDSIEASTQYNMNSILSPYETKLWKFSIQCISTN